MTGSKKLSTSTIHTVFLFLLIAFLLILFFQFLAPFLATLFMAAVLATVVYPFYRILRDRRFSRTSTAIVIFLSFTSLVVVPLILLFSTFIDQAGDVSIFLLDYAQNSADGQIASILEKMPFLFGRFPELAHVLTMENLASGISDAVGQVSGSLVSTATGLLKNISFLILQVLIFCFALFYFLIDGVKLLGYIKHLLPLSKPQKKELFEKVRDLMHSMIFGIIGGAIVQGVTLGLGLSIAGVDNPLFWAMVGAIFSPVPYVGVGIIWMPIVISLFLNNHWGSGTFLLIWCIGLVSNIDNIVKPYLIGAKSQLHPFAVMLIILGGIFSFGFQGLIFGPFILMLLLSFLHIYELEYGNGKK